MFRPLWAILRSQKCIMRKTVQCKFMVVVHVLNFQRDRIMQFIHVDITTRSTSEVDRVKVHVHVVRDVL